MAVTYILGGLDLGDRSAGYGLLADTRVWGGPSGRRVTQLQVYGRPGVVVPDLHAPAGPRTLPLVVRVTGTTHAQLRDRLAALYAAVVGGTQITRRVPGLPDMVATFTLADAVDWPEPRWDLLSVTVKVNLLLVEGVWAETTLTTITVGTTAVAWQLGDAPVYDPQVEFPAGANPTLTDVVSGAWLRISATTSSTTAVDIGRWSGHAALDASPTTWRMTPGGSGRASVNNVVVKFYRRWFA